MYNPIFPPYQMGYANQQAMNYQPPVPQPQQSTQPIDERIFVANESAAEAYLLAPNGFARLWDSSRPFFYEKQADATGRQFPMVKYQYFRVDEKPSEEKISDYEARIKALEDRLSAIEERKANGRKKAEVNDE